MANDSRSSRKAKEEESINSKKKFVHGKAPPPSVSGEADTSGLRRSARETSSRKQMTQSPSSMRKSERLEKRTPTPSPAMKKSVRAEKQPTSPLTRSDRGNKYSSSSSSGSKKSGKDSTLSDVKGKRETSGTSLNQLTEDTSEVIKNENQDLDLAGKKRKGMNARSYKALFKSQRTKVTDADRRLDKLSLIDSSSNGDVDEITETPDHVPQIDSRHSGGSGSESLEDKDNGEYECGETKGDKLVGKCNERVFEGPIGVSDHLGVEISISREKISCTKGQNDPLNKDGISVSKNSAIVEGTVDDTAMLLVDRSKTDLGHSELVGSTSRQPLDGGPNDIDSCRNSETGNKTVSSNRNVAKMDTDVNAIVDCKSTPTSEGNATSYQLSGGRTQDSDEFVACSKKRRLDYDFKKCEGLRSCETTLNKNLCGTSIPKDRGQLEPGAAVELVENANATTVLKGSGSDDQIDTDETKCFICKLDGELIVCDGKDCKRSYHHACLDATSDNVLTRVWHCPQCVEKKIKSGVYSVSEGIESIWDSKDVEISDTEGLRKQKQYFVKYKGLAHIHNKWIPAPQLLREAPLLLTKFDRKNPIMKWNAQWIVPQRLLKRRLLMPLKQQSEYNRKHAVKSLKCHYEWLVKWCGLDYEHATWELENASFLRSNEGQNLIRDYENRLQKRKRAATPVDQTQEETIVKLSKLPAGCPPGIDNNHLGYVNKLRDCWSKGQCAVVFDDQERVSKVVLFILSLKNASQPFLIITTSNVLSLWENEFSRLASSIHVLVYNGKKENRECIRVMEFYGEGGQIIFQVLLSSMETIVEDAQMLERIRWEAVIVDECQRANISTQFKKIKTLVTETRMLLFTSPMKENVTEYRNVLAFLGSDGEVAGSTRSITVSDDNLGRLKESLLWFIAYDCICESSRFVEYWVPVHLSNLQLEQYCATLLSNSLALCSCSKTDPVGALRDIIVSSRKCCDHPYIIEPSLQVSITKDVPGAEYLDIGIKASGKLQLLDGILSEMKKRQLRVLILFQPITGSGREPISIGDILDDFIRQRFGQDSYERLDGGVIVASKRQTALNNFNKDKGRFVFLLEHRACLPSVKLSSVDAIIIFDSELNPMNDLRALQRIRIYSQSEQITIFRFYACCTVEEKILLLADHDLTPEKLQNLNKSTSEAVLMWGASYLFHKLDDFHSSPNANISCEHPELNNLVEDILDLIPQDCKSKGKTNSIITRVEQTGGTYSKNIPLFGKLKVQLQDGEQPHMFWRKLLEGRSPLWKYLSASTPRQRKRVHYSEESPRKTDAGREEVAKKQKKLAINCTDAAPFKPVLEAGASGAIANCGSQHVSTNRIRSTEVRKETTLADNSLHDLLKIDVSRLCQILTLSEKVNVMIERFLKYIIENHRVSREPATILQAFLISLCWIGASLIRHKIDKTKSLALAKKHMEFTCTEEEAISVYSKLKLLTESFLSIMEPDSSNESGRGSKSTAEESLDIRVSNSVSWNLPVVHAELEERPHSKYVGDEVSTEQGQSANRETSKKEKHISEKQVYGKCEKQMLTEKHLKEIEKFDIKWRNKEKRLQSDYTENKALIRVIHSNLSVRLDKIKALDTEFAKRIEEHNRQRDIDFEDLKGRHLAEEIQKSAAKSSTGEGRAENELPLHGSQKKKQAAEYSEASEYGTQSGTENVLPLFRDVMQGQGPDGVGHNVHLSEVVPANIPGTPPDGTVGCNIPIEKESLLVTPNSGYDEVGTMTLKKAPEAMIVQPHDLGGSGDGADNSVSASHHYLGNQIPDGNTSCTHAEEVPAECGTFPNEAFVCKGSVNAGTPLLESNEEYNGGGTSGPDMLNTVRKLNDRTPGSYNGNSPSMSMLSEKGIAHPVVSPASRHSNPDLKLQNECPQLSSSIGVQDEDAQGNQSSSPQVDSAPVVAEQNDQANTEGQGHEPSERLHLPLSTNPQLAHSQPDLPLVSGVVDEPPFSRQNTPDNAGAPPQFVEDLADVSDNEIFQSGESLETHRLVDTELPTARNQPEWSAVVRHERQPSNELHNSSQNMEVLPQVVQTTVQVPSLPGLHTAPSLSIAEASDSSSQVGSRMSTPADPLLIELERLRKEMEHVIVFHEDMKLRLKSECEKEIAEVIAQINSKYESKRQDAEAGFLLKRKELDTNQNKVLMNKVLADAFRSKCLDIRTSGGIGMQQVAPSSFMQQLRQLSWPSPVVASSSAGQPSLSQHTTAARPSLAVALSSACQPSLSQQTTAAGPSPVVASSSAGQPSLSQRTTEPRPSPVAAASSPGQPSFGQHTTTALPLQFVNNSAALFSSSPIRPPNINPITPSAGNLRVGGEIRAPAPHIRPFRPSTSVSPASLSSFQRMMPSQHVQSSLHPPTSLPQTSSRPPSPTPPAPLLTNQASENQHGSSSLSVTSVQNSSPLSPPISTIHSALPSNHAPSTLPAPPPFPQASSHQPAPAVSANLSSLPSQHRSSNLPGGSPSLSQASYRPLPPSPLPTLLTNQSGVRSLETPSALPITSPSLPQSSSRPSPFSTNNSSLPSRHAPISLPASFPSFQQDVSQQPSPAGELASLLPVLTPVEAPQPSMPPVSTPVGAAQPSMTPVLTPEGAPQPPVLPGLTPAGAPQPSVPPILTDISCLPSQRTAGSLPAATSFSQQPQVSSQTLPTPPPLPPLPPLLTNPSGLYSRSSQLESAGVSLSTPNNNNVSALELLMQIDNRAGGHQPILLPPLTNSGSNVEPWDLSELETTAGNEHVSSCPSTLATDIVCLSDDD